MVSNLLINAIQLGAEKRVEVEATSGSDSFLLKVHNQGNPIPAESLGSIFDPLVRGKTAFRSKSALGLGLFIVKEIVSAHDGTISVTSSEEAGTTFTIRWPAPSQI